MAQIELSDQLFAEAQRKAAAVGMSVDRFVADAVQLHLHEALDDTRSISLTSEQVATIRQSQAEIKSGKGLTMEQVDQQLAAKRAAWLKTHQP
jgi:hypothetical protein